MRWSRTQNTRIGKAVSFRLKTYNEIDWFLKQQRDRFDESYAFEPHVVYMLYNTYIQSIFCNIDSSYDEMLHRESTRHANLITLFKHGLGKQTHIPLLT